MTLPGREISIGYLRIRFDWKIAVLVVLSFSVLLNLGFWQLNRAEEKRRLERTFEERQSATAMPIESLSMDDKEALKYLKVSLVGSYINDKSIFIDNQTYHGRLGHEVITAFRLKSNNQIVLVSRGWKSGHNDRQKLPELTPIQEELYLTGELYVPPGKSFFLAEPLDGKNWPMRLHHFHIEEFKQLFEAPVFPYPLRLNEGSPGVLERHWPPVTFNPGMNTSYAIQWFIMSFAVLLIAIVASTNIVDLIRSK